uniref:Uncharacterized protein n=1 Tax=Oryza glumipatula TaxID=40148 RepID=A0A0E0BR00_9ORYZ
MINGPDKPIASIAIHAKEELLAVASGHKANPRFLQRAAAAALNSSSAAVAMGVLKELSSATALELQESSATAAASLR